MNYNYRSKTGNEMDSLKLAATALYKQKQGNYKQTFKQVNRDIFCFSVEYIQAQTEELKNIFCSVKSIILSVSGSYIHENFACESTHTLLALTLIHKCHSILWVLQTV